MVPFLSLLFSQISKNTKAFQQKLAKMFVETFQTIPAVQPTSLKHINNCTG